MFPLPFFGFAEKNNHPAKRPRPLRRYAPALPKGEPLAVPANFISLPRPLPLGEVDLRSKDGEGEPVSTTTPHKEDTMKHCVKKLLSLAFALALCLAVGGIALAETPEQEVLDYEQNVTAEPGTNTTGNLATEGYQVTIPTTVTVKSGEDKETLMVTADVRQMRTLTITLDSTNSWQLKHESGQVLAGYSLTSAGGGYSDGGNMWYQEEDTTGGKKKLKLHLSVGQKAQGDFDINWKDRFTIPLTVAVDPSQATMSGTYSDTVSFAFAFTHKSCVTYFINVYEQELQLTNSGAHVQAVNMVNADGTVKPDAKPVRTEIWEYPVGNDVNHEWSYGGNESDAELRWEKATATMNTAQDEAAGKLDANKNVTINLNLVRKWYWLDVNGATDYTGVSGEESNGNQGGSISGCVNMQVSADNGTNWSSWFWQSDGDDYWGQFPYGIHFKLGLHHVKNGYVYEMSGNGVKIIANKQQAETAAGVKEGDTTYYVYTGELTGEPTGTDVRGNVRYCYIPCYKKGLTYMANQGTGGKEDVNGANKPRTNVLYQEGYALESPEDLNIHAPSADMEFAGWSTSANYPTTGKLYQPGAPVSTVNWENYTDPKDLNKRPQLNGAQDKQKRELYAIWKKSYTVKVQFGRDIGWTTWDAANQSFPESNQDGDGFDTAVELGKAYAYGNTSLTLSKTENKTVWDELQAKITEKTSAIADTTPPKDVWQLKNEYTVTTLPANGEVTISIKRKRYLLNVIPALKNDDGTYSPVSNATDAEQYGKFDLKSCGKPQTLEGKISYYQWMRNYGGSYSIYNVVPNTGYLFVGFERPTDKGPTTTEGTGNLTGKNSDIHYFGDSSGREYTGDTIYVVYEKDTRNQITFDYNGGITVTDGATKLVSSYDETIRFPKVVLSHQPNNNLTHIGWSTEKNPTSDDEIFKLASIDPVNGVNPDVTTVSSKVKTWPNENKKVLYAVWSSTGPNRAPAKKKALTVHYHANFDPMEELALDLDPNPLLEDMDEDFGFDPDPLPEDILDPTVEAVKIVTYKPDENVVLRHCMFKRGGYVFVGWNTEPDGTGIKYEVNGVPITDWAAGTTVDLYAQWKKPEHLKPVVDGEPQPGGAAPAPTPQPGGADDAFGIDPHLGGMDDAFGVDPQPGGMDDAFGIDPQSGGMDDAFGVDPQSGGMDDAFGVDPHLGGMDDAFGV